MIGFAVLFFGTDDDGDSQELAPEKASKAIDHGFFGGQMF